MEQRQHGAEAEFPLEAERHVDQDSTQRQQHAQAALVAQLFTHRRANELCALDEDLATGILAAQRLGNMLAQQRVVTRHPDQHIGGGAKTLHQRILEAALGQLDTYLIQRNRVLIGQLDQRAAGEIQAEIQTFHRQAGQ